MKRISRSFFRGRTIRGLVWLLLFAFVAQTVGAEVVRSDNQPKTTTPTVSGEVVRSDGQPRVTTPAVSGEVVRSDGQPRVTTPAVSGEVVRSDGQPRVTTPAVSGEVVRSDGQPRSGQPQAPANLPKIQPFVGEVAVGVSLLIAYGPQILALAATVASLAAAVSYVANTTKQSVGLVKSIGDKMQRMLQLLLGPLTVSNGMAKEGVQGLSGQLLDMSRYVTNSLSAPVVGVQGQLTQSLEMAKDLQGLTTRGMTMANQMKGMSDAASADMGRIVAGGEVQLFRDGARNVMSRLSQQAQNSGDAFSQTLENTRLTTQSIEEAQKQLQDKLGGQSGEGMTLSELGISGAEMAKNLVTARKYMVQSDKVLAGQEKAVGGLHQEIIGLLSEMKIELQAFALAHGVDQGQIDRAMKVPAVTSGVSASVVKPGAATGQQAGQQADLANQIGFMVDNLTRINAKAAQQMAAEEAKKAESRATAGQTTNSPKGDDLYQDMMASYKRYLAVMTADPGNQHGIALAREEFDRKQAAYQEIFQH